MSSKNLAIKVDGLSKSYQMYSQPSDRLKQFVVPKALSLLGNRDKKYYTDFWALKEVSFNIEAGETVGIIGRNGSGKSTLLQLICGTLFPTSGEVETNGRIAALLELGSGFNPEFTGRENIIMGCSILGLSQEEIDNKLEEIIDFSEIREFIDQPAKTYSSGMFVRLAFSVNIMSDPEIMIVDEALAVGDMNFQAKCMTAMTELQKKGVTVLFVSHDIGSVKSLCSKAVYLERGEVVAVGNAPEIADMYVRRMHEESNKNLVTNTETSAKASKSNVSLDYDSHGTFITSEKFEEKVKPHRYGNGKVQTTYCELLNSNLEPVSVIDFDEEVTIKAYIHVYERSEFSVNFSIFDEKKNNIIGSGFKQLGLDELALDAGKRVVIEYKTKLPIQEGYYSVRVNISKLDAQEESAEFFDVVNDAVVFQVARWQKARVWSKVHLPSEVRIYNA